MRSRYSAWNLVAAARRRHADWAPAWRDCEPKPRYDVLIVGGGGHGLATAYYLARNHGVTNVAVIEAGWIGGGNTGRNTTIVRSNYLYPQSANLYDFSVKLYENLAHELNFNIMFSQRGMVTLAHSRHDLDSQARWTNAMRFNGVDAHSADRGHPFQADRGRCSGRSRTALAGCLSDGSDGSATVRHHFGTLSAISVERGVPGCPRGA